MGNLGEGGVRQLTQGLLLYPQDAPLQTIGFDLIKKQAGELMMSSLVAITLTSGEGLLLCDGDEVAARWWVTGLKWSIDGGGNFSDDV